MLGDIEFLVDLWPQVVQVWRAPAEGVITCAWCDFSQKALAGPRLYG